jgi:hypothetical protein
MHIRQLSLHQDQPAPDQLATLQTLAPQLLLVFAAPAYFERGCCCPAWKAPCPAVWCWAVRQLAKLPAKGVEEGSAVLTAIRFGHTRVASAATLLQGMQDSQAAGQRLATALQADDLQLLLLLAPGTAINGTALLDGLQQVLGDAIPVVGGMAADDGRFCQTFTLHQAGWNDHQLVAVGLYGGSCKSDMAPAVAGPRLARHGRSAAASKTFCTSWMAHPRWKCTSAIWVNTPVACPAAACCFRLPCWDAPAKTRA